jgi:hypothetical protein
MGLLHDRHADGCDGQEYSTVRPAPYGHGFAVVVAEWCGDCGAADYDVLGYHRLDPEEVARR